MNTILPQNETQSNSLVTGAEWLDQARDLSAVSETVVLNTDLGELVNTTLSAACANSQHTARAYMGAIGLFLTWLSEELGDRLPDEWQPLAIPQEIELKDRRGRSYKKNVWEFRGKVAILRTVNAGMLDNFAGWRMAEGDGRATVNLRRRAVNTFLAVALRDGILTQEQATNMRLKPYQPKQRGTGKITGRRLSNDEVRELRKAVEDFGKPPSKKARDRAIIDSMLFAALRRSEVASLTTDNFTQDGGRWWLVLTGKGNKKRRVKVHDTLYKSLNTWLEHMGLTIGEGSDPVFYSLNKAGASTGKISGGVIGRIVVEYGFLAGLAPESGENVLGAHDLRRTCARNAYNNGASLIQIQNMLGHADPKTTAAYIGAHDDDDNTAVDMVRY